MSFRQWWRTTLSPLGLKLFSVIVLVNVLISGALYFTVARSIDDGFIDYLRRTQQQRIDTLTTTLAEGYRTHGSWEWLTDNRDAWQQLLRVALAPRGTQSRTGDARQPPLPPALGDPRQFVLLDEQGRRIIGRSGRHQHEAPTSRAPDELRFAAIRMGGRQVGSLGYRAPDGVFNTIDRIFLHRQLRNLGIIIVTLLISALLLAGGLAFWLGRRTRAMALATRSMAEGDYSVRLAVRGRDELAGLSRDINTLAASLERGRRDRQQWVADIAHELRTPLTVLRGEIEAIEDGVRPMDQRTLGALHQEVEQLGRLVEDLRLLAQSDAHNLAAPMTRLDLGRHLAEQLEESREALARHGLSLAHELPAGIMIHGSPHRLRQLWSNLLGNTRSYTDPPGQLAVTLSCSGEQAVVVWEDSAPGVPDQALARLTERLFRLESSRNRRHGGSGLGLSIASALTKAHHATLTPARSPLGGLRWTLCFPLASSAASPAITEE
ncbi:two-component system sensor histidine kinase BaeS [Kushneria sinocarnis]|uniref:histidine kinase n=1 Tax=Kushneria sinocarnis TaxID=595502 RepID=A0A420WZT5_9GAMM|nr:ATP-binding protein [Kushneria sinocarnis]RKR06794.1 two-component system sensor histidine kinase BaeS [Kushneria sinocarnis]